MLQARVQRKLRVPVIMETVPSHEILELFEHGHKPEQSFVHRIDFRTKIKKEMWNKVLTNSLYTN